MKETGYWDRNCFRPDGQGSRQWRDNLKPRSAGWKGEFWRRACQAKGTACARPGGGRGARLLIRVQGARRAGLRAWRARAVRPRDHSTSGVAPGNQTLLLSSTGTSASFLGLCCQRCIHFILLIKSWFLKVTHTKIWKNKKEPSTLQILKKCTL